MWGLVRCLVSGASVAVADNLVHVTPQLWLVVVAGEEFEGFRASRVPHNAEVMVCLQEVELAVGMVWAIGGSWILQLSLIVLALGRGDIFRSSDALFQQL